MTLSDGRTATLRVGDIVNLTDDHKYRVLKNFAPAGPIVFKRTDGSTHRSFLRTPDHVVISAPTMVSRSTQTDPHLLFLMILLLTLFYNVVAPMLSQPIIKAVLIVSAMFTGSRFPNPSKAVSSSLRDTNYKKEGIMTMPRMKECRIKTTLNSNSNLNMP